MQDVGLLPVSAMTVRGALAFLALLVGVEIRGAEQAVMIRLAWSTAPPEEVAVTLRARDATGSAKPLEVALKGRAASIALPAGQWFVSASSPGYWSEPALISVTDQPVEGTLTLYPAARLRARVTMPTGEARALDVYFSPSDTASRQPRGSTACAVLSGQLDCEVPAGLYDLVFRVPGHVSVYRWDVDLRGKPSADLGKLAFRRGSTFSGHVAVAGGHDGPLEEVEVTLRHSVGGDRNDAMVSRQSVARMVTRPDKRGFFSFEVLPGSYVVSASSRALVSEERQVTVIDGREASLEEPLVLQRLWTLTVNVQLPPGSKAPWKLAVVRFDSEGHPSAERVMPVPSDGVCRFEQRLTGSHGVELRLRGSVWASESVFMDADKTVDVPVRVMRVHGSLRLGEHPLQADLMFLSREKGIRIPIRSRADGTFQTYLPDASGSVWEEVEIQSSQPTVKRVLENVPVERDDEGVATIDLRLPDMRIEGLVVDENARPAGEGMINISAPDGFRQIETSDGTFTIHGLQPGRYALTAATPERETEEPLFVDLPAEGAGKRDVVLKVAPAAQLLGSIGSATGPVIGASVFVAAANDAHPLVGTIPVDTTGTFDLRLPPHTRDVQVAVTAPGYSFRMMRLAVPKARLDIVVDQNGGALSVDGRVGARAGPFRPYLIHNGAILNGFAVAYLARGRFLADPEERLHFEIPSTEEGPYSLCLLSSDEERIVRLGGPAPQSRCASGVLARHGSLNLRAPAVEEN